MYFLGIPISLNTTNNIRYKKVKICINYINAFT